MLLTAPCGNRSCPSRAQLLREVRYRWALHSHHRLGSPLANLQLVGSLPTYRSSMLLRLTCLLGGHLVLSMDGRLHSIFCRRVGNFPSGEVDVCLPPSPLPGDFCFSGWLL